MSIFSDGVHVISDKTLKELHDWAAASGVKRGRFASHPRHPHYDLPKHMQARSVVGAKMVSSRDLVRVLHGHVFKEEDDPEGLVTRRGKSGKCGFCDSRLVVGAANRYIYPVPGFKNPWWEGRMACPDCAPEQQRLQVELGLVVPIGR